ncbi:MAG: phosphoglucosamine mutase, partial [archaeon GBS-70-058]|nr:phosphoglucosamine mutase [Candidatus Culexarchaeum nevadense]
LILREFHMARDGAIATLAIIREVMESGKKVSEIISEIPRYYMIKTNIQKNNINLEDKIDKLKVLGDLNLIDGVKISSENWWALIRPSRTEPKIRIIVEAREREQALETIKRVLEIISC